MKPDSLKEATKAVGMLKSLRVAMARQYKQISAIQAAGLKLTDKDAKSAARSKYGGRERERPRTAVEKGCKIDRHEEKRRRTRRSLPPPPLASVQPLTRPVCRRRRGALPHPCSCCVLGAILRHYSLSSAFSKLESLVETQQPATEDAVLREKFKEATNKRAAAVQKELNEVDKWLSACMGLVEQPIEKIKTTVLADKAVNDLRLKIEEYPAKFEALGRKPVGHVAPDRAVSWSLVFPLTVSNPRPRSPRILSSHLL